MSVASLALTPLGPTIDRVRDVGPWVGLGLLLCEGLFLAGLALMAVAGGVGLGRNPLRWRRQVSTALTSLDRSPLFWAALGVNTLGAAGTALVLALGITLGLPARSWGLLVLPAADLALTVAMRGALVAGARERHRQRGDRGALVIRPGTSADLGAYIRIQEEEWGSDMAASLDQLESRLTHNPRAMVVAEVDGAVVAAASFLRLPRYDVAAGRSWDELTDRGWGTTHVDGGKVLSGVDLSVSRNAPRTASSRMQVAALELTVREGAEGFYWGSRMPRYHRHADRLSAAEYVRTRNTRGRLVDPELEVYSRIPGVEVIGVVPDYFEDWESLDYGAILRWRNPVYRFPALRPLAHHVVRAVYLFDRVRRRLRH